MEKDDILKAEKETDRKCQVCGKPLTRIESTDIGGNPGPVNNLAPEMWGMESPTEESLVCENPQCSNFQKVISGS